MPTGTLTSKGQTVIPKAIRDHLRLHPGDALDFVVQDNGDVMIRPATDDIRRLKGILHRRGRSPISIKEMNEIIRNHGRRTQ